MSGLTNKDFEEISCAHCGETFPTTPKAPDKTGPNEVPWVDGGIISFHDDDGTVKHYHGYFDTPNSCFAKAHPDV
jgi:hypothetical protein